MKTGKTIYCDYQATTPLDPKVLEVMHEYLQNNFANPHSKDHFLGSKAADIVKNARTNISEIFGIDKKEMFFTSGATEANNLILQGITRHTLQQEKVRIISSPIEHKSILSVLKYLEQSADVEVEYVKVDCDGIVDLTDLERLLQKPTTIVSVIAVNNEIGTIQPIKDIYKLVKASNTILHCDIAQAICSGVDIYELAQNTDAFSFSGHKIYGPKGIGGLFLSNKIQKQITPLFFGGGQQNKMRSGTLPPSLIIGLETALQRNIELSEEFEKIKVLRGYFWKQLQTISPTISLNGPGFENRHCGNLSVAFEGVINRELINSLQPFVAASTGSACNSSNVVASHVFEAIGISDERAKSSVRFSLGRFSDKEQIDDVVCRLKEELLKL